MCRNTTQENTRVTVLSELLERYGHFMSAPDICRVLHYPSVNALRAAKNRGRLPFKPMKLPGRPGIFAASEEIAALLETTIAGSRSDDAREVGSPSGG